MLLHNSNAALALGQRGIDALAIGQDLMEGLMLLPIDITLEEEQAIETVMKLLNRIENWDDDEQ